MIVAIELAADKATRAPYPWQERRGLTIYRHALDARRAAAADRQRRLLHAAVRGHHRGDRPDGGGGARRHRARHVRLTRVLCRRAARQRCAHHAQRQRREPRHAGAAAARRRGAHALRRPRRGIRRRASSRRGDAVTVAVGEHRADRARIAARHHARAGHLARRAHGSRGAEGDRAGRRAPACRCSPSAAWCGSMRSRHERKLTSLARHRHRRLRAVRTQSPAGDRPCPDARRVPGGAARQPPQRGTRAYCCSPDGQRALDGLQRSYRRQRADRARGRAHRGGAAGRPRGGLHARCASVRGCCAPRPQRSPRLACCSGSSATCERILRELT